MFRSAWELRWQCPLSFAEWGSRVAKKHSKCGDRRRRPYVWGIVMQIGGDLNHRAADRQSAEPGPVPAVAARARLVWLVLYVSGLGASPCRVEGPGKSFGFSAMRRVEMVTFCEDLELEVGEYAGQCRGNLAVFVWIS